MIALQRRAVVVPRAAPATRVLRHHRLQDIPQLVTDHAITKHERPRCRARPQIISRHALVVLTREVG